MLGRGEGTHSPSICTPLVGKDRKELLTELAEILLKKPDIIEWRLDFYEEIQYYIIISVLIILHTIDCGCN